MDQSDLKILLLLKQNSRISLTKIAEEVSLSVPAVTYRLNKLIDRKIITSFTINIDETKLTPNYISYMIKGRITRDQNGVMREIIQLGFFDRVLNLASFYNFVGITRHISSAELKSLLQLLEEIGIIDYEIITITEKSESIVNPDVIAEEVNSIYCPLCQKELDGVGIVTRIGNQIMGFCCDNCKNEFEESYEEISSAK